MPTWLNRRFPNRYTATINGRRFCIFRDGNGAFCVHEITSGTVAGLRSTMWKCVAREPMLAQAKREAEGIAWAKRKALTYLAQNVSK